MEDIDNALRDEIEWLRAQLYGYQTAYELRGLMCLEDAIDGLPVANEELKALRAQVTALEAELKALAGPSEYWLDGKVIRKGKEYVAEIINQDPLPLRELLVGKRSVQSFVEPFRQQAEAWEIVCETLDAVSPGWLSPAPRVSAGECALRAIRGMAARLAKPDAQQAPALPTDVPGRLRYAARILHDTEDKVGRRIVSDLLKRAAIREAGDVLAAQHLARQKAAEGRQHLDDDVSIDDLIGGNS